MNRTFSGAAARSRDLALSVSPSTFTTRRGFRLAASIALVLTITAELVIGNPGIGRQIDVYRSAPDAPGLYALVLVTGLLGLAVNLVTRLVERRVLHWHPSVRREGAA